MQTVDYLIIGAGISGLLAGTELRRAGASVRILDKGRGFGGRMATRRMGGGRLDHGAQFFTVRDARFQAYADQWLQAGIIKEWYRHAPEDTNPDGHSRYCGVHGMTDVPKFLAENLLVHRSQKVVNLKKEGGLWVVTTEEGNYYLAKHLILTAPLPQAIELLDNSEVNWWSDALDGLREIRYEKGLATLAILSGPSGLEAPGGQKVEVEPLTWIADNYQKGISPEVHAVTLHANADFAEAHWDSPNEVRGPLMLQAAEAFLKAKVVEYDCHRWGFTRPIQSWGEACYIDPELQLSLAGDAFGGRRVEGAALSGIEVARRLTGLE